MLIKNKKKIIITSAITIMVCIAIIAGSTMALFSGEVTLNVAVTAGSFEVVATPVDSNNDNKLDVNRGSMINGQETGKPFVTVTSTDFDTNDISLAKFTPGDWISFKILVKNNSDIAILCQPEINKEDDKISKFLDVSWRLEGATDYINEASTPGSAAIEVDVGETITLEVRISMDEKWTAADLKGYEKGNVQYNVVAWQSNAEKPNT